LSYPRCFCIGTTWVRQPTTFCFFTLFFLYLIDLMLFTFCRMSYPCL
jgi:hypothetical protein